MIILRRYFQLLGAAVLLSCALPLIVWAYSILHVSASGPALNEVLAEPHTISLLMGAVLDPGERGLLGRLILLLLVTGTALAGSSSIDCHNDGLAQRLSSPPRSVCSWS
jgi:hypothetical protein